MSDAIVRSVWLATECMSDVKFAAGAGIGTSNVAVGPNSYRAYHRIRARHRPYTNQRCVPGTRMK